MKLRLEGWGLFVLGTCVILAAYVWAQMAEDRSLEHRERRVRLASLAASVNRLDALEWRIIASAELDPWVQSELDQVREEASFLIGQLQEDEHDPSQVVLAELTQEVETYNEAVDLEIRLIEDGAHEAAERIDEQRVDPAFEKLLASIGAASASFLRSAEREHVMSHALGNSAVASANVLTLLLLWMYQRTRRRALAMSARQMIDKRAHENRRELLQRTVQAAEKERMMVAVDLHDGPIQGLTALMLGLESLGRGIERGKLDSALVKLQEVQQRLSNEIGAIRNEMSSLRSPALNEKGLAAAIGDLAGQFSERTGIPCTMRGETVERLDPERETLLYRTTQEALANVAKHAHASRVHVSLGGDNGWVHLEVQDNGIGFDAQPTQELMRLGHFGLASMQERVEMAGGVWELETKLQAGTRIKALIPSGEEAT